MSDYARHKALHGGSTRGRPRNAESGIDVRDRPGTTLEVILNAELARLLRQHGLEAEAEQSVQVGGRRHQIDVLVELGERAVAIEAEFAPARTLRADAEQRLPEAPLRWRGLPVTSVFEVVYPERLKKLPESRAREELASCEDLEFQQLARRPAGIAFMAPPSKASETRVRDSVTGLAECMHDYWIRTAAGGPVEETVELASEAIQVATEVLQRVPKSQQPKSGDSDAQATTALIWLNALLFQMLLAQNLNTDQFPPEHRGTKIPMPENPCRTHHLWQQWTDILKINWWPIFHVARETLNSTPPYWAKNALDVLLPVAAEISEKGVIRHHDIAGRIFHRLLETRKFLATNYTTIPAAVLLAGLAFDRRHPCWKDIDWTSPADLNKLRIVDPACGTGTLLMAALQEILRQHRRSADSDDSAETAIRPLLEHALHGYDVVPAAVHLTAATLSMAEASQLIKDMPLYRMPHDVRDGKPRLGSLDFLQRSLSGGKAQFLPLLVNEEHDPSRTTGTGERTFDVYMPNDTHLMIANPPYTRAGGPGDDAHTSWNPMFGSVLSTSDASMMTDALKRTLQGSPANLYAGLGSAFVVLAQEKVRVGGRLAFVLPATALTGIRWSSLRQMLLQDFDIDWVVVSHDARNRHAHGGFPGRRFVAFSESTRIAEAMIVATRRPPDRSVDRTHVVRFVNLRHNPDDAINAMEIARALLDSPLPKSDNSQTEIGAVGGTWGEVLVVEQASLGDRAWTESTFVQGRLSSIASSLVENGHWCMSLPSSHIPITTLAESCDFGPYHMQIKNPKQGLFTVQATTDQTRAGHPALWHHEARHMTTLGAQANARLVERSDRDPGAQSKMLDRAGRLQLACELGHAPQRVSAVIADEAMIGISSWITLHAKRPARGKEEALCLWLNSSLGLLLRIVYANRPYLGRSRLPHSVARSLPVLDIDALSKAQLEAAHALFHEMKQKPLLGFAHLAMDPVRRELDNRLLEEVLGYSAKDEIDQFAKMLNREPTITARH